MIKQGLLCSQSQGFQQPILYRVTPVGTEYLQDTWKCVKFCQNLTHSSNRNVPELRGIPEQRDSYPPHQKSDPLLEPDRDEIRDITNKWLKLFWEEWFPDEEELVNVQ